MTATERVIRWSTAGMVFGVAAVAAVAASYELVRVLGGGGLATVCDKSASEPGADARPGNM